MGRKKKTAPDIEKFLGVQEKICPVCRKVFVPAPQHMYRYKGKDYGVFVCSYSCRQRSMRIGV